MVKAKITERDKVWKACVKANGQRNSFYRDTNLFTLFSRVRKNHPGAVFLPSHYNTLAEKAVGQVDFSRLS